MTLDNTYSYISSLTLHNFRNHQALRMGCDEKFMLILGENGSGKTNILEAISMLSAGRGLRNCKNTDVITDFNKSLAEWAVDVDYFNEKLNYKILLGCKFGYTSLNGKKVVKINSEELKRKSDVLNVLRVIWLTPQMESLFLESPNIRRKFLDRMTFNFFPEHAKQVTEYEYFLQSRSKILCDTEWDENWLEQTEMKIAALSIEIIYSRLECIKMINSFLGTFSTNYLKPLIFIKGEIENMLEIEKTSKVNGFITDRLKRDRIRDAKSKRCTIGAHKSEVVVINRENNRVANLCSTGEQKSMIIALLLGQAHAIYKHSKVSPILLLDEIFAHLDSKRKEDLISELKKTPSQIWISSTDTSLDKIIVGCKKFVCR